MSMTSYGAPKHAWYFIALVHRLAFNPHGNLVFVARAKALNTIRTRLHHARQFITTSAEFSCYQSLCLATRLKVLPEQNQVHLQKLDMFDSYYDIIIANPAPYDIIIRDSIQFVVAPDKNVLQKTGLELSDAQCFGLREFYKMFPAIRQAIVEANVLVLRK